MFTQIYLLNVSLCHKYYICDVKNMYSYDQCANVCVYIYNLNKNGMAIA